MGIVMLPVRSTYAVFMAALVWAVCVPAALGGSQLADAQRAGSTLGNQLAVLDTRMVALQREHDAETRALTRANLGLAWKTVSAASAAEKDSLRQWRDQILVRLNQNAAARDTLLQRFSARQEQLFELRERIAILKTRASARRAAQQEQRRAEAAAASRHDESAEAMRPPASPAAVGFGNAASWDAAEVLEDGRAVDEDGYVVVPVTAGAGSGVLVWPTTGAVTSGFGPRWGRQHEGIDIGAPEGTPIQASAAGTVTAAGWGGGYGNLVVIDHGNGLSTAYAHQAQTHVTVGAVVATGQTIGAVGNTGHSFGAHLHFETRIYGTAVDPQPYL